MAATVALVNVGPARTQIKSIAGDIRIGFADVTFSNSYPTGGETVDFASTQLSGRTIVHVDAAPKGGYVFSYDRTSKKLLAYRSAGSAAAMAEVPNTTDLSAVTTRCLVITL